MSARTAASVEAYRYVFPFVFILLTKGVAGRAGHHADPHPARGERPHAAGAELFVPVQTHQGDQARAQVGFGGGEVLLFDGGHAQSGHGDVDLFVPEGRGQIGGRQFDQFQLPAGGRGQTGGEPGFQAGEGAVLPVGERRCVGDHAHAQHRRTEEPVGEGGRGIAAAGAQAGEQEEQDENGRQTMHGCSLLAGTVAPAGSGLKGKVALCGVTLAGVSAPAYP